MGAPTKTIVIDLDGTLCEQTAGGKEYFTAKPIQPMIDKLHEYAAAGWRIVIYTARGMNQFRGRLDRIEDEYREGTEQWLEDNHVPWDWLVFGKMPGDLYVDDKGASFHEFLTRPVAG